MGLTGWTDTSRDLRNERSVIDSIAESLSASAGTDGLTQVFRHAAFARRGAATSYADWRHPERPDPDLMLIIDGALSNRDRIEEQLYQRPRPLSSDAEVLLHAYRRWGAALVDRIDGNYAIAVWDEQARQLLLVRDPLGAKTLYWTPRPNALLFASQATALLAHPDVDARVDAEGLNELLTLGPVRTPGHGVVCGVRELLPGQLLRATPAGIRLHRYWQLQAEEHGQDLDGTVHQLRQAYAEKTTVLRQRPPGAILLSGGIASATAAAFTTPLKTDRPTAYTLTLATPGTPPPGTGPDLTAAAHTASHLRLGYRIITVDASHLLDAAPAGRQALDFPGPANLDTPLFALLRHTASRGHTSVVSGDGADAVFGGYRWLHDLEFLAHDEFPWRPTGLNPTDLLNDDARWHLIPGAYRKLRFEQAIEDIPRLDDEDVVRGRRRMMSHLALTHYLPQLLVRLDQLATAAGVTVHTPHADWLIAQYLWNVPHAMRHLLGIPNGLLRHTTADLLPAEVTWLPNRPFPGAHLLPAWNENQRERLHAIIADPAAPLHDLLHRDRTRHLLAQPATAPLRDWHTTTAYLTEVNDWLARHHVTLT
ncbi:asparagine synthetase B family protein [Actinoplanes sp. GCM10030250]|uniref:asparagine synthetase B family protein n=1 Tax=Actinoplanes sp. GCM10030250 TaxID=3273376 RepID=UPI003614A597